jgi:short-subunit dehydrogenase
MAKNSLRDRVVIITGASSGIGAATAVACGAEGMRVVLAARREALLQGVAAEVEAAGGEAMVCPTDVADAVQSAAMVAAVVERFGRVDVLLANAGIGSSGWLAEIAEEEIERLVAINLLGVIHCVRAVLPVMLAQGQGHILTVSSIAGGIAMPRIAVYAATKAGVHRFAEGLRREVRPRGIFVTDVVPGFIDTPMLARSEGIPKAPVDALARAILAGLRRPRRAIVFPAWYQVILAANLSFPGLIDWLLAMRERREGG